MPRFRGDGWLYHENRSGHCLVGEPVSSEPQDTIIDLHRHSRQGSNPQVPLGDLLQKSLELARDHLRQGMAKVFEQADDTLFDSAEKAGNNQEQALYFEGMRLVRKQRQATEARFLQALTEQFDRFSKGNLQALRNDEQLAEALTGAKPLTLVEDDDLEENLAIDNMVSKAENRNARALHGLNQRLTVISGGREVKDDNNPVGPKWIGQACHEAFGDIEMEIRIKLILYKLFDKHVMDKLGGLYEQLNQMFIDAGVLPQIQHQIRGHNPAGTPAYPAAEPLADSQDLPPDGSAPVAAPATGTPPPTAQPAATTGGLGGALGQLVSGISNLLRTRRGDPVPTPNQGGAATGAAAATSATDPAAYYDSHMVVNALSLLQQQFMPQLATPQAMLQQPAPLVPKEQLMAQLQQLDSSESPHRVSSNDEDAIDLVAMLFEFIVQDRNLPSEIQALLSRLQIPYLKAALLDRHLFTSRQHPARLLLDEMAQVGMGWSRETDKGGKIIGKLTQIVETLLSEFDDDLQLFTDLHQDLLVFTGKIQKRAEKAEERTREKLKGQEKLEQARRAAATALKQILDKAPEDQPQMIQDLVTKAWANVLVLLYLRQGESSPAWKNALKIAHDLLWIREVGHNPSPSNLERLKKVRPVLNQGLRKGLKLIAYRQQDIEQLVESLNRYIEHTGNPRQIQKILGKLKDMNSTGPADLQQDFVEDVLAEVEAEQSPPESLRQTDPDLEAIRDELEDLETGTWFEFKQDDGEVLRAKLSWISPISGKYLFVNQKGLKVADKSLTTLAEEIHAGQARALDQGPLLDRALGSIVERLHQEVGDMETTEPALEIIEDEQAKADAESGSNDLPTGTAGEKLSDEELFARIDSLDEPRSPDGKG